VQQLIVHVEAASDARAGQVLLPQLVTLVAAESHIGVSSMVRSRPPAPLVPAVLPPLPLVPPAALPPAPVLSGGELEFELPHADSEHTATTTPTKTNVFFMTGLLSPERCPRRPPELDASVREFAESARIATTSPKFLFRLRACSRARRPIGRSDCRG
jgi:hypothetical protein